MDQIQKSTSKLYARKKIDTGIYERIGKDGKKSYQVIVRLKPYPPESDTFDRLTDARKWQEDTKSSIRDGRYFKTAEAKKHTLGELIDRYIRDILPTKKKSEVKQTAQLLWWKKQIGGTLLSDVTSSLLGEQRDKLAKEQIKKEKFRSPSTVVRYIAALSHAFTIALKEWGWVEDSPMRKVTKPKEARGRVRFLSDEEKRNLLMACKQSPSPYLYTIVVLALSTGMRHAEIMNLKWSDVDMEKGRIILHETKNGERRAVPVAGLALQLLKELGKIRRIDTMLIFPGKEGKQPADIRFSWEKATKDSKVSNFRFHDLRHTAASYLAMNGASLAEIAEILGHKTLAMVKRYAHFCETHTAGVVARMNERFF